MFAADNAHALIVVGVIMLFAMAWDQIARVLG